MTLRKLCDRKLIVCENIIFKVWHEEEMDWEEFQVRGFFDDMDKVRAYCDLEEYLDYGVDFVHFYFNENYMEIGICKCEVIA